jgi:chemotaxis protein histidine kinase CheA
MELDNLEQEVRLLIIELMMVLYSHEIYQVHMGGILRLLGVEEEVAKESDEEFLYLDDKFVKYMRRAIELSNVPQTQDKTIH